MLSDNKIYFYAGFEYAFPILDIMDIGCISKRYNRLTTGPYCRSKSKNRASLYLLGEAVM